MLEQLGSNPSASKKKKKKEKEIGSDLYELLTVIQPNGEQNFTRPL
jgi:hypothetical protein